MATQQVRAADLQPGMVYEASYGPRTIKSVGVEREHGKDWLVWRWDRQPRHDGIDCGYGGVLAAEANDAAVSIARSAA